MVDFSELNLDIEGIISELTGEEPYQDLGSELRYICPFCQNPKAKFYVNADSGLYTCFNCEERGNIITLAMKILGTSYSQAMEYLEDWGIASQDLDIIKKSVDSSLYDQVLEITKRTKEKPKEQALSCPLLPTGTKSLMMNFNNPEAYPYFAYLQSRGVTLEQIKYFDIHYTVSGFIERESGSLQTINTSIIFITHNENHVPIYWNTRAIEKHPFIKTINAPASKTEYSKKDTVFNLNNVVEGCAVVIAESVLNAITINIPDKIVGTATFGKKITDEQIDLYKKKNKQVKKFFLFLDGDAKLTQYKLAQRMQKLGIPASKIYLVFNPSIDKDINDYGLSESLQLLAKARPLNDLSIGLKMLLESQS